MCMSRVEIRYLNCLNIFLFFTQLDSKMDASVLLVHDIFSTISSYCFSDYTLIELIW